MLQATSNETVRRSRASSNAVLAANRLRRLTVESSTPQHVPQPDATTDEPPTLILNAELKRASRSQLSHAHVFASEPSVTADSSVHIRPRGISLNSETKPLSSKSAISDVYTARWKISASEILNLLVNDSGLIKDVKHRFFLHKKVIVGSELVTYFLNKGICQNRQDAVDLGHHLLLDDILQHEYQEDVFKDKYLFYIIPPGAAGNAAMIGVNSDESDDDFNELIVAHDQLCNATENANQHLAQRLSKDDSNDYLCDARLQDDVAAAASVDRFFAALSFFFCWSIRL